MSHRIIKLLIAVILVVNLSACGEKVDTKGWTVIQLDEIYSFKVPSEWVITKIEGKLIFSDRELDQSDVTIHMMEVYVQQNSPTDVVIYNGPRFYGERIKEIKSEMSSIGTFYSVSSVKVGEKVEEYRFLEILLRDGIIRFVVVNKNLETSLLKAILNTKTIKVK